MKTHNDKISFSDIINNHYSKYKEYHLNIEKIFNYISDLILEYDLLRKNNQSQSEDFLKKINNSNWSKRIMLAIQMGILYLCRKEKIVDIDYEIKELSKCFWMQYHNILSCDINLQDRLYIPNEDNFKLFSSEKEIALDVLYNMSQKADEIIEGSQIYNDVVETNEYKWNNMRSEDQNIIRELLKTKMPIKSESIIENIVTQNHKASRLFQDQKTRKLIDKTRM